MEYLLLAAGDAQTSIKPRLSKLRHLDSLFFFLLIIALLFFQFFQQSQLRQEIRSQKSEQLLEELLTKRLSQLERTVQELRIMINKQKNSIHQSLQENKKITLELAKQLGLPVPDPISNDSPSNVESSQSPLIDTSSLQVIEMQPQNDDQPQGNDQDGGEQDQNDNFRQQEVIRSWDHSHSCTYMQYLLQSESEMPKIQQSHPSIINNSHIQRTNINIDHDLQQLKKVLEQVVKIVVLGALIAGILLLTFQKRRKGRHNKPYLRRLWNTIYPEDKKKPTKENKEAKEWQGEKSWNEQKEWIDKDKLLL